MSELDKIFLLNFAKCLREKINPGWTEDEIISKAIAKTLERIACQ